MLDKVEYFVVIFTSGIFAFVFLYGLVLSVCILIFRWHSLSPTKKLHYISITMCFMGGLNFVGGMLIVETLIMGGTALHGKIEGDQYYLGEIVYTPVSSSTFLICKYYEITIMTIFAISSIAALITYYQQERPRETLSLKSFNAIIKKKNVIKDEP